MPQRIDPPAAYDEAQRAELAKTPLQPTGEPLNVFGTMAHLPAMLRRVNAVGGYFPRKGVVAARERELAVLRTARRIGSSYVERHHRVSGAAAGLSAAELDAACDAQAAYAWAPADAAILAATDELVAGHMIGDAAWDALGEHFDDGQHLELIVLVGFYVLMGGYANSVRLEVEPGF